MKNPLLFVFLFCPAGVFGQTPTYNSKFSVLQNFKNGYADTFNVNNNAFRIIADTTNAPEYRYQLEKFTNGLWSKRFSFGYGIGFHSPDYIRKIDFNCDNFCDLVVYSAQDGGAYIFDTAAAEFVNTPIKRPYKWVVLNSAHRLVCSLEFEEGTGNGVSLLYTFSGFKIYPLYYLLIKNTNKIITSCTSG